MAGRRKPSKLEQPITPFEEINNCTDRRIALEQWRKWTRLTLYAVNGLLVDSDGSMIETEDVRLVQEVALAADHWMATAERLGSAPAEEAPRRSRRRVKLAAVRPLHAQPSPEAGA